MSGDIVFYAVEKMFQYLSKKDINQGHVGRAEAVAYCHGQLDAIEYSKTGCQVTIDDYREQLKKYI